MTRHEVERLMEKASRQRKRVIREFVEKAHSLEVGQDFFQCFISSLPEVEELRELLNGESSTIRFKVWPTINGIMVLREQ